jgi:hypothetical protein
VSKNNAENSIRRKKISVYTEGEFSREFQGRFEWATKRVSVKDDFAVSLVEE